MCVLYILCVTRVCEVTHKMCGTGVQKVVLPVTWCKIAYVIHNVTGCLFGDTKHVPKDVEPSSEILD